MILARVPDRTPGRRRIPAPERLIPTGRCEQQCSATEAFREKRNIIIRFVQTTEFPLRDRVATHPALGDIDGCQWIVFLAAHCERHIRQLEEAVCAASQQRR